MITNTNTERKSMKRFAIREVETVKTTAALYSGACGEPFPRIPWGPTIFA